MVRVQTIVSMVRVQTSVRIQTIVSMDGACSNDSICGWSVFNNSIYGCLLACLLARRATFVDSIVDWTSAPKLVRFLTNVLFVHNNKTT